MSFDCSPTSRTLTHHVTLEDALGVKYGLILFPTDRNVQRRPRQSSEYTPFTQGDWSGGRGLKSAKLDASRYGDSKRLITRRAGDVMLAGQETYATGHRDCEQFLPQDAGGLTWQSVSGANGYIAFKVTASATSNRLAIYLWLRRRGTPATALTVSLRADDSDKPAAASLKSAQITAADITDTVSELHRFAFASAQAVTATTVYWVVVESAGDATNYWQIGTDAARTVAATKKSADGSTWAAATYDLFYRLVDTLDLLDALKFRYKDQLYAVTRPAAGGTPALYMNGYRGVATGATQSRTQMQDSTQAWAVNELAGKVVLFPKGPCSELPQPYATIVSNSADTLVFGQIGNAPVAGSTEYVILGTNAWHVIAGHGLTVMPTSVCSTGDVLYLAQGDAVNMRRMIEANVAGVWTRTFAEEDNKAKLLLAYRDSVNGVMVLKGNDSDNSGRASVARAKAEAWGARLEFPWLIEACEATTSWTFGTGVTGTADASVYKCGTKSIKMVVAAGADAMIGRVTFTNGISLKNRHQLRFWLYSSETLDKGKMSLRLASATDGTGTIQEIDLPEIVADEWTLITLPYQDHKKDKITAVKAICFLKTAHSGTVYVDSIEAVPGESETLLGNEGERLTGLELYGDPQVPWVLRSGSIGSITNGAYEPIPLREYSQVENLHNGAGHVVFDVYLFFSFLQGVEQYYRNNLDDVGPNRDEGLPAARQGYVTSMVGYPGRFFCNYDAGPSGNSSIFEFKGGGYHEIYRCDTAGQSIHDLFLQIIPGLGCDRLWFSQGSDLVCLPLPGNTANEATDSSYRFTHEGVLETAAIGEDLQQIFTSVQLFTENASAAQCIECDYRLDEATAWTPIVTPITSGPIQKLTLNVTGKRLYLRLRLQSSSNTETPHINRMVVSATTRPETRYTFTMGFQYMDGGRDLQGNVENYSAGSTLLAQLDSWMQSNTPLTMHSMWPDMDNKTVFLEPVVTNPLAASEGEATRKYTATLIAVEP